MHINFTQLDEITGLSPENFLSKEPYPHLIIDNFLTEKSYKSILKEIPEPRIKDKSSDYIFAKNKFENPLFDNSSVVLSELRNEIIGEKFTNFLNRIYGKKLFIDPFFVGGGLHQGGVGSFLDMHADFSRHPIHRDWVRELNILFYINPGYEEHWGGHLEMHNSITNKKNRIAPLSNRLVIMLTKEHTLHGYKKISFPEGLYRTSIASYAYSIDTDFETTPERSTLWRPDDSIGAKTIIAKISPFLVKIKRSIFGSSTAKRANRDY